MIFVNVDVPMERWPITNWVLIGLTCFISFAVWGKQHSAQRNADRIVAESHAESDDASAADDGQIHDYLFGALRSGSQFRLKQLVTYQFVHGDFWHLFGNMLFLFCFGNAVNAKLGHVLFLAMYLGLGIIAGLGWKLMGNGMPIIGASGAIAGLNGVFLVLYPMNEVSVHTPQSYMYTGDAWRMPSWVLIIAYMALDLWGTLAHYGGVGYACHLAGEVAGVAIASGLVLARVVTSNRGEMNLLEIMGVIQEPVRPVRRKRRVKPKPSEPEEVD